MINITNKKKKSCEERNENIAGYLFALPAILGFIIFTAGPMITSLYYSFTSFSILSKPVWIGFKNYIDILTDPFLLFKKSLSVTLIYAFFNVIAVLAFSLIMALILNRKFKSRNLLRAVFFMPSILPLVSTVIMWNWLLMPTFGLLNQALQAIGIVPPNWFMDEQAIYGALIMMSLWSCGGTIVVILAALQDVPVEMLEAVKVDGGNAWHRFKSVILPFISPVLFFQLLMTLIGSLQIFTQSIVLSGDGGPNRATYFINVMVYDEAFQRLRMGLASSVAWVMFIVIMIITVIIFSTSRFWVFDDRGGKR